MVMLAICRIQRPVSLEFGASVVCGGGVCVCGGTSRAIVGDINLVEPLVSLLGLFWVLPFSLPSWSATSDLPASSL